MMAPYKRTVLIAHQDRQQREAWKSDLENQNVSVTQVEAHAEIGDLLDTMKRLQISLPDLILIDIGAKSRPPGRFSECPQAETVCRWIWKNQVETKVVILSPKLGQVSDIERAWAKRQGAIDVLPRLCQENLIANIQRIADVLVCDFLPDPLKLVANHLLSLASMKSQETDLSVFEPLPFESSQQADAETMVPVPSQPTSTQQSIATDNDNEMAITYRGVKMQASQMPKVADRAPAKSSNLATSSQQAATDNDDDVIIYRGIRMKRNR